jgi:hypothetical protein
MSPRYRAGSSASPAGLSPTGGRPAKELFTVEDNGVMMLGDVRAQAVIKGSWTRPR